LHFSRITTHVTESRQGDVPFQKKTDRDFGARDCYSLRDAIVMRFCWTGVRLGKDR
jgi:hypothetical protein